MLCRTCPPKPVGMAPENQDLTKHSRELTVKLKKSCMLPAILGAKTATAQDENQAMWSLQFGKLPASRSVVGQLDVRKDSPPGTLSGRRGAPGRNCSQPPFALGM